MKRKKIVKIFSMMLSLMLVLTMIPSFGADTVWAADTAGSTILYIIDTPGGTNETVTETATDTDGHWAWDAETSTLTLDGFNGEYIESTGPLNIVLKGANTITMPSALTTSNVYGIEPAGKINISGDSEGSRDSLTISQTVTSITDYVSADVAIDVVGWEKPLTVNDCDIVINMKSALELESLGSKTFFMTGIRNYAIFNGTASLDLDINSSKEATGINSGLKANTSGSNAATVTVKALKADTTGAALTATYTSDTHYGTKTSANITVDKKDLYVKAKDQKINVNGTLPDLTTPVKDTHYTVDGLVGSDTLSGTITMDYQKDGSSVTPDVTAAGTYDIVISGATASDNYTVIHNNGTLTVAKKSSGNGGAYVQEYTVTINGSDNGTVTANNKTAAQGETIVLSPAPNKGYELATIKVTDKKGDAVKLTEKDNKFSFTMPASNVTVTASFSAVKQDTVFEDVPADAYYKDAVTWAVNEGITTGVTDVTFEPDTICNRAQIVTFMWRTAGSPEPKGSVNFTDVPGNEYYAKAVAWAAEEGIVKGISDTTFAPEMVCTREQTATILYRFAISQGMDVSVGEDTNILSYDDASQISEYAVPAIQWSVGAGIMQGSDNNIMPQGECTRAQFVTMLYRLMV